MVQQNVKPPGKLHAACDECRTRKLKCSGHTPRCVRCQKEKIECVYSPQKQMGRPRKRMREDEADEPTEIPAVVRDEHVDVWNDFSGMPDFTDLDSLLSPPLLQDVQSSDGSAGNEIITPQHHDLSLHDQFQVPSGCNDAYTLDTTVDPLLWNLAPNIQPDIQPIGSHHTFSDQPTTGQLSVMKAVVERFNKVLIEVDREALRLEETGQKKPYRIGDNNPALQHLHTGTLDCPMGFNIEIEGKDWKKLVKTALKTEVYGGGSNPRPLLDLVKESEARQESWHTKNHSWSDEMKQLHAGRPECDNSGACEALGAQHIRRAINNLRWD
ncbi:hypothetical protein J4E82_006535 [Alternaria postmessia]|uniref:uncharacterized protein n=1 Tax=Alternaria postmessia TaxID=1187938 RepID=UPI002224B015|nr:uncharacterized protein J4E82_006535 [Alternaria postmessia]KAI5374667.1 hypothetical protein J4E82_006535 [Alternaria postmessia]